MTGSLIGYTAYCCYTNVKTDMNVSKSKYLIIIGFVLGLAALLVPYLEKEMRLLVSAAILTLCVLYYNYV